MKKLKLFLRGLIIINRDMFLGFLLGICCAAIIFKINPKMYRAVGFLIPTGVFAGSLKGFTKFMFMNLYSSFPEKEYKLIYPRFKILFIWLVIYIIVMIYVFGINPGLWFSAPIVLLKDNILFNTLDANIWRGICAFIALTGILAHLYEPSAKSEQN